MICHNGDQPHRVKGRERQNKKRKSASLQKKTYIISDVYYFEFSCGMRSIFFCQTGRQRVVKAFIRLRSHRILYPSNTREQCFYCSAIMLMAYQEKSSPKSQNLSDKSFVNRQRRSCVMGSLSFKKILQRNSSNCWQMGKIRVGGCKQNA